MRPIGCVRLFRNWMCNVGLCLPKVVETFWELLAMRRGFLLWNTLPQECARNQSGELWHYTDIQEENHG